MRKEWIIVIGLGDGLNIPIFGIKEEHHPFRNYQAALAFKRNAEREGKWARMHRPKKPEFRKHDT